MARNNASLAHPNELLLGEAEARLVINGARSPLTYIDDKSGWLMGLGDEPHVGADYSSSETPSPVPREVTHVVKARASWLGSLVDSLINSTATSRAARATFSVTS